MIPPSGSIRIEAPSALPDFGSVGRALVGRLGERDVAHVRDRRLHDAGEPDPGEAAVRAQRVDPCAQLLVARELECRVEARLEVAGVVERPGRRPVGHLRGGHEIAAGELGRVEAEAPGRDRHRPLEREVELRAAEAAVEAGGNRVREDDAVARGDVLDAIGAGERPVHPVQRRRLGRAHVRADVLDRVVAERDEAAVGGEARLDLGHAARRGGARREVLEPVFRPADGHAEPAGGETEQDDVGEHRRLDPERPAGVGRRQQPQPVAAEAERRRGDAVQRERALEVRPRGQPPGGLVPVGDDRVALDRRAREAGEAEGLADDEVGPREGRVDVAVGERALVDAAGGDRVEHGLERVVLDLDELGRVLGEVAVSATTTATGSPT